MGVWVLVALSLFFSVGKGCESSEDESDRRMSASVLPRGALEAEVGRRWERLEEDEVESS